ncbi:MAG: hypothetical protein AAGK21_01990, partial [Bacteroidota bacterium]
RGIQLAEPFLSHFTYFTAWVETDGALRLYADPYSYDARLAEALGLDMTADDEPPAGDEPIR